MSRYTLRDIDERRRVARAVVEPQLRAKRDHTVSTFYERVRPGRDGRIHTSLAPRTASWRFASSEYGSPSDASTNLQNAPKKVARMDPLYRVRDVFVPEPGFVLLAGDYKGAESVLAAAYSRDWKFLDALLSGHDVHTDHAKLYFPEPITPLQRDISKTIYYASLYCASATTIHRQLSKDADLLGFWLSQREVADIHRALLSVRPLQRWWTTVASDLRRSDNVIRNAFGYPRRFYDPDEHNRVKDACSFLCQSTIAACMNRSIVEVFRTVDRPGAVEILHQNHDELIFQAREALVERVVRVVSAILRRPITIHGRALSIPVEWKAGKSWGEMETVRVGGARRSGHEALHVDGARHGTVVDDRAS